MQSEPKKPVPKYSDRELPPHPTPGKVGGDARQQRDIERGRNAEREREKSDDNKPGPYGT